MTSLRKKGLVIDMLFRSSKMPRNMLSGFVKRKWVLEKRFWPKNESYVVRRQNFRQNILSKSFCQQAFRRQDTLSTLSWGWDKRGYFIYPHPLSPHPLSSSPSIYPSVNQDNSVKIICTSSNYRWINLSMKCWVDEVSCRRKFFDNMLSTNYLSTKICWPKT